MPSSAATVSVLISMLKPVNLTAKRTLTPFLPIAKENESSLTMANADLDSSSTLIPTTCAGYKASMMNNPGTSL